MSKQIFDVTHAYMYTLFWSACSRTYIYALTHMHEHTFTFSCMDKQIHAHTHTHALTHAHIHTCKHMYSLHCTQTKHTDKLYLYKNLNLDYSR